MKTTCILIFLLVLATGAVAENIQCPKGVCYDFDKCNKKGACLHVSSGAYEIPPEDLSTKVDPAKVMATGAEAQLYESPTLEKQMKEGEIYFHSPYMKDGVAMNYRHQITGQPCDPSGNKCFPMSIIEITYQQEKRLRALEKKVKKLEKPEYPIDQGRIDRANEIWKKCKDAFDHLPCPKGETVACSLSTGEAWCAKTKKED